MALALTPASVAQASTWQIGDVFAGVTPDGVNPAGYRVFDNAGAPKEFVGKATSTGNATGCGFDAAENLWGTFFQNTNVIEFANAHPHADLRTIDVAPTGAANTESLVFDAAGNFYVGNADGDRDVVKYDPAGTVLGEFDVEVGPRGSDFIDLARDQKTLFYTSEGDTVRRYDVSTGTQLAPFATGLPGSAHYGLRLLPPGDGSGGLVVAAQETIQRLDGAGNVVQSYDAPGQDVWFALNLDPNGTSFWSADLSTGDIFRFNLATGAIEVGPIANSVQVGGLCILGEPTAAVPRQPPPPPPPPPSTSEACGFTIDGVVLEGTAVDETLSGSARKDHLRGAAGNDSIFGLEERDCLFGNADRDRIKGDDGNDVIRAGRGNDKVSGGEGNDNVKLQDGDDKVKGKAGDDRLQAKGRGVDKVNCGPGEDTAIVDPKDKVFENCEHVKLTRAN